MQNVIATYHRPPQQAAPTFQQPQKVYSVTLRSWEMTKVSAANENEAKEKARALLSEQRKFRQMRDWEDNGSIVKEL